ncbi:MAG: DUF739 family protein [Clostridia bacterium]|nr:DUF739 family protein [Clostridia bacterium]
MAYDYRKLIGRIIERYGSRSAFAKAANMAERTLSRKLNNKAKLSQDEIALWCRLLEISEAEAFPYFFTRDSQFR